MRVNCSLHTCHILYFAYLSVVFILAFSNPTPQSLLPAGEIQKISVYISPFQCVWSYCSVTRQIINNFPCVVLSRANVITAPFLALFIRRLGGKSCSSTDQTY